MPTFRHQHLKAICLLPSIGSIVYRTYYIHEHSNVSLDTLRLIFEGHTLYITTPLMTEVFICSKIDKEVACYRNEIYFTIRLLLEAGDERNNDQEFIYCSILSVIVYEMLREQGRITRAKIKQVEEMRYNLINCYLKPRILSELYLNRKFLYCFQDIKSRVQSKTYL